MIEIKDLHRLYPIFFKADGFLALLFGDLAQNSLTLICSFWFSLNVLTFEAIHGLMDLLYQKNIFMAYLDDFFLFSKKIYDQAFNITNGSSLGYALVIFLVVTAGTKFLMNKREEAKSLLIRLFLILVIAIGWFGGPLNHSGQDGRYYLATIDQVSNQVESFLLQATGSFAAGKHNGTIALSDVNTDPKKSAGDLYFQKTVVEPYLLMNYGTIDTTALKNMGIDVREFIDGSDEELTKALDQAKEQYEKEDGALKSTRGYLSLSQGMFKVLVATFSFFGNFAVGVPLLMIVFARFFFQIAALFLVILLPFSLILALLPTKQQRVIHKIFGNLVSMLFGKAFLSVGLVALFLLFNLIDSIVTPTSLALYVANSFLKIVTVVLLWKKREKLFEKLGLSYVTAVPKAGKAAVKSVAQAPKELQQKGLSAAGKTLSMANKLPLPPQMKAGVQDAQLAVQAKQGLSQTANKDQAKTAESVTPLAKPTPGMANQAPNQTKLRTNQTPPTTAKSEQDGLKPAMPKSYPGGSPDTKPNATAKALSQVTPYVSPPTSKALSSVPHRLQVPPNGTTTVPFRISPEKQEELKQAVQRQRTNGTHGHVVLSQQVVKDRMSQQMATKANAPTNQLSASNQGGENKTIPVAPPMPKLAPVEKSVSVEKTPTVSQRMHVVPQVGSRPPKFVSQPQVKPKKERMDR